MPEFEDEKTRYADDAENASRKIAMSANRRFRIWWFRAAAVLLGLSVFVAVETVCVLCGVKRPKLDDDPFVGFSAVYPLFELDESASQSAKPAVAARYVIPKSRRKFFAPESFPTVKSQNTFRVFCLGGSTVQGRPFSKQTSFTTWLKLSLQAADPNRNWEVINCGGVSYASYRLIPILQECLRYEPDLFIVCTGHNEFLEDRTYGHIRQLPAGIAQAHASLTRLRSYALARQLLLPPVESPATLKSEVDAMLDYQDGLRAYHRDTAWRDGIIQHFRFNLRRMVELARTADVPIVLIRPPVNLSDTAPFKSQHRDGLTPRQLEQWQSLVADAQRFYRSDVPKSVAFLQSALEIDDEYAATYYELGQCYATLNRLDEARRAFVSAKDQDVCPLRILEPMARSVFDVAVTTRTPVIDAHGLLEENCPSHILGGFLLVDHVHPSVTGHQMIAAELTDEFTRQGWLQPSGNWQARRETAYKKHLASLDTMYYSHGLRTLENVKKWTQGKADGPPLPASWRKKAE